MGPIVLLDEDPPDDVVVVGGGEMRSHVIERTARRAHAETGIYTVSVFLALDGSVDELCVQEPFLARYRSVRLSTAGRVRQGGSALIATLGRPHYEPTTSHDGRYTEAELQAAGTINAASKPVDWTKLKNVPSNLAGGAPNPLRVATLRWYEANQTGATFAVGVGPAGVAFDDSAVWV